MGQTGPRVFVSKINMELEEDIGLHNWTPMTLKNTKAQVDLVALVYLIDPGVLVSLVALLALMAFQGISDLQDRTNLLC
jgi:hypothetical protein